MTRQSHSQAYTMRKPNLKKTHISHCSLPYYLQQLEHASNPDIIDRWIDKEVVLHIHNVILLSHKRNTFESVLMSWSNLLEPIIQSEVSHKEKDKYCSLTYIYGIQKNGMKEFIYRATMEKQTQRIDLWTWGEGRRG